MLPDFIICGAQKAGTTTLFNYLDQHPEICTSKIKEVHFFDWNNMYNKGLTWYETQFEHCNENKVIGEASPYYMFVPEVPRRIKKDIEHVKLIFILRNPTDRAYSHYWHEVRSGWETSSFEDAIKLEAERIKRNSVYLNHYSYLERGKYFVQLERFSKYFAKNQLFILKLEDLKRNKKKKLCELFSFLDVNTNYLPNENIKKNKGGKPRILTLQKFAHKNNLLKTQIWNQSADNSFEKKLSFIGGAIAYLINIINISDSYPPMNERTRIILNNYFEKFNDNLLKEYGLDYTGPSNMH